MTAQARNAAAAGLLDAGGQGMSPVRISALKAAVRSLIWAGVLLLCVMTMGALLARNWWVFDLFTHFRAHYVLLALVLLVIALLARRFVAAVVTMICGAVHAVWLLPLFLAPSVALTDVPGSDIRLATINMLSTNPTPERVIAVLDQYQPDIVALQEVTPWWPMAPAVVLDTYPYQAPLAWELGRSVTLISRYPITAHQMWSGGGMNLQFPVLSLDIDGRSITVIAVHPPYPGKPEHNRTRQAYLDNIAEAIRQLSGPVVVLGDFNATPFSPVLTDMVSTAGLRNAAEGFGYLATWPSSMGLLGIPIDQVFVSREFAVSQAVVGSEMGSDHAPFIMDVRLLEAGS